MVGLMEKEVEYISDGNYNYLRINCGEERNDTYVLKMITENEIKGLIPCRLRFINGNTYLYYEIQSKQAIYHRYEIREINYEALIEAQANGFTYINTEISNGIKPSTKSKTKKLTKTYIRGTLNKK